MKRHYPPKAALPFLASIAILSVASFMIRSPKPVGIFLRALGAGAAVGYVAIESKRRRVESGEEALDNIALAMEELYIRSEELEQRKAEIYADIEAKLLQHDEAIQAKLAEIEGEWEAVEAHKMELTKIGAELSARRAALEFEQETWEKDAVLRQKKLELELHDRRHEVEVREHNIAVREAEFKTMTRTAALQEQALLEQQKEAMLSDHQSRMSEVQHEMEKVITDREVLEERFLELTYELQAAREEASHDAQVAQAKLDEMVAEREEYLEATKEQLLLDYEEGINAHIIETQEFIDHLQLTIAELQAQIEQRDAVKEFGAEDGYAGMIGNKILAAIRSYELQIQPHQCRNLPHGTQTNPAMVIWLKMGDKCKFEQIASIKTNIESAVGIHPLQMVMDKFGFVVVAIGDVRGAVEMPPQPASTDSKGGKAGQITEGRITEPSPQMIEQTIGRGYFYIIAGPPRAGKSAWVNNLISYRAAYLGKNVEFIVNNLKYPDPGTPLLIRGERISPKYCLTKPLPGAEKFSLCVDGLTDMYASATARRDQLLLDEINGRPFSRFKKRMWIIDEAPALSDAYRSVAKTCISNTIRIGGALDEAVVLIGQSYNPDDYGVRRPILHNVTQFYLGASYAQEAIRKKQIAVSATRAKELMSEIHARQALAAKQIEENILVNGQPPARYFALVAGEGEAFLMTLPPPGAYDDMPVMEDEEDDVPIVSDEDLISAVKSNIYEEIEKAKSEDGLVDDEPQSKSSKRSAPGFNTSEMSPLQRAIVEFCQSKLGQSFSPSAIYGGSRQVQSVVKSIRESQKPSDRKSLSSVVEEACVLLVEQWDVGAIERGGKGSVKYGIER